MISVESLFYNLLFEAAVKIRISGLIALSF